MNNSGQARMKKATLLLLGLLAWVNSYAGNPILSSVQVMKFPAYSRLIFTLSEPGVAHVFTLSHPDRLVVDFEKIRSKVNTNNIQWQDGRITGVRVGFPKPKTYRMVFDLSTPVHIKKFQSTSVLGQEFVLDVTPSYQPVTTQVNVPSVKSMLPSFQVAEPRMKSVTPRVLASTLPIAPRVIVRMPVQHPFVVVLDAGHGGKDPGTIGSRGTKEKNIVLKIALRLAELINNEPSMRAKLTRKGDYFVTLRNRLRLARRDRGDLFVAIHADSYFNDRSSGASVYALSKHGATTEAARWLANHENDSELGGVDFRELSDKSYVLRSVLIDLAQTATISDSVKLGTNVLAALRSITDLHYKRVEQAPFMVLKSPDIPSILIETGFLSNPDDEAELLDKNYRDKLANAILRGIKEYIASHPNVT